jgi:RimJ/RimL family protein N-acetyltransferase
MRPAPTLVTARTRLRPWTDADRAPFAALNADPEVMAYFPSTLSRHESDALVDRIRAAFDAQGFGFWALEVDGGPAFVGFVGLSVPPYPLPFGPCVEIGWRLARTAWGHGYAQEAAREALRFGLEDLALPEIVSFTARSNLRSQRVMQAIGMQPDPAGDFVHPRLPAGHPLAPHVLYRKRR